MTHKHNTMKLGVILTMIIFVGSSIGLGILMMPSQSNTPSFPSSMVINSLTPSQEKSIMQYGGTIIYFDHQKTCDYCNTLLDQLKGSLQDLKPYVFIVYRESNTTQIKLVNSYGEKVLTSGGLRDIVSFVCASIPVNTKQHSACLDYAITAPNSSIMNISKG